MATIVKTKLRLDRGVLYFKSNGKNIFWDSMAFSPEINKFILDNKEYQAKITWKEEYTFEGNPVSYPDNIKLSNPKIVFTNTRC